MPQPPPLYVAAILTVLLAVLTVAAIFLLRLLLRRVPHWRRPIVFSAHLALTLLMIMAAVFLAVDEVRGGLDIAWPPAAVAVVVVLSLVLWLRGIYLVSLVLGTIFVLIASLVLINLTLWFLFPLVMLWVLFVDLTAILMVATLGRPNAVARP